MSEVLYLVSPAGNPNFGDEAIAAGWLRFLARTRPDAHVVLDCPNPLRAGRLLGGIHPRLSLTDGLWRACFQARRSDARAAWNHVLSRVLLRDEALFDRDSAFLFRATSIHLLGGGYLNSVWANQVGLVAGAIAARRVTGAKLFGTGLGLMPQCPGLPELARALATFDHVSCRDSVSSAQFRLASGLDDVFLGIYSGESPFTRSQAAAKDVMVCVQDDLVDPLVTPLIARRLRQRIHECREDGKSIGYVEAFPGSDRTMFEQLDGLIRKEDFVSFDDLWRSGLPMRTGQEWYTSRFHLHLTAAAAGAAGTALGVKRGYYDVKHESLQALGTGWQYAPAGSAEKLRSPTFDPDFRDRCDVYVASKLEEALMLYPERDNSYLQSESGTDSMPVPMQR